MSNDYKAYVENDYLSIYHHGILGMKWGVRRFQNEDGSLTPEGKRRYGKLMDLDESYKKQAIDYEIRRSGMVKYLQQKGIDPNSKSIAKEIQNLSATDRVFLEIANDTLAKHKSLIATGEMWTKEIMQFAGDGHVREILSSHRKYRENKE